MTQSNILDSWDSFCGFKFLKTNNVTDEKEPFLCTGVDIFTDEDGNVKPRLALEKGDETYFFDLNITNSNFCRKSNVKSPKALIGRKLFFKKIFVNSPKTKKEVESLRICKIE